MLEAFFSQINRSKLAARKRNVDVTKPYLEDFNQEEYASKIFYLLSEPLWYHTLLVFGYCNIMLAYANAIFATINDEHEMWLLDVFYLADICWFINMTLAFIAQVTERVRYLHSVLLAPGRSNYLTFAIDFVSVLPLEMFAHDPYTKCMLMLNRILKIVNVIFIFHYFNHDSIRQHLIEKVYQLVYLMTYAIMLLTLTLSYFTCSANANYCKQQDSLELFKEFVSIVTDQISTRGIGLLANQHYMPRLIIVNATLFIFIGIFFIYVAEITFHFYAKGIHKNKFCFRLEALRKYLANKSMPQIFINKVEDFYDVIWKVCAGYDGYMNETRFSVPRSVFDRLMPFSMFIDLQTDNVWEAFAHSTIFKNIDMPFLRLLSTVIENKVFMKGQYVFHRNKLKQKFIYIFTGTVNILSQEDDETPLLTLVDGTCLSETSLIIPRYATANAQCASMAILMVLTRADFLKIAMQYPHIYKTIWRRVFDRYNEAKIFHNVQQTVNNKEKDLLIRSLSMRWINVTLHKVMGMKSLDATRRHSIQNIYLTDIVHDFNYRYYLFTAKYLQLLTIGDRGWNNADSFFVRTDFPLILQPGTGVVLFWDLFIALLALIAGILIPYQCLVLQERTVTFYTIIYVFTFLWFFDLIVKTHIAVQLRHVILTRVINILLHKLSDPAYLVDILSCIPFEIYSSILVWHEIRNLIFLNRLLKIYIIIKLFARWEQTYDNNPIIVRGVSLIITILYSCYFASCCYFYIKCVDGCDYNEFIKILYYASQLLTGVANWVPVYSQLYSRNVSNIVILISIAVSYTIFYALIFSAFFFTVIYHFTMKNMVINLVDMVQSLNSIHTHRIHQNYYSNLVLNNGLNYIRNDYMFHHVPIPMLGYFFEYKYLDWMMKLPLFLNIPRKCVVDVLQQVGVVRDICPGEVIFYVGDLCDDIIVLAEGFCEKISGQTCQSMIVCKHEVLNALEVIFDEPCRNTYVAASHCDIIMINYRQMLRVLAPYCRGLNIFGFNLRYASMKRQLQRLEIIPTRFEHFDGCYFAPYANFIVHNKKHPQYFEVFMRNNHSVLRRVLARITVVPQGGYFFVWAIFRAVAGLLSAFLFPTTGLIFLPHTSVLLLFMYFLELVAWLDIIVRFHVCYYNNAGLMITHPLYTVKHYLHHGFFIDFIAALPIYLAMINNSYIILNVNKILQIHHYISLINFIQTNTISSKQKILMFKYWPILCIFINAFASLLVSTSCTSVDESNEMECSKASLFYVNHMDDINPFSAHLYAFYIIVATVSTISIQGYTILNKQVMIIVILFAFSGFYWRTVITAKMFVYFFNDDMEGIINNFNMERLKEFMTKKKIKQMLQKIVVRYFQLKWYCNKKNVQSKMAKFPIHIQRDILFECFGKTLVVNCLYGAKDNDAFIRNMLVHSKYHVLDAGGYLVSINDVIEETIILFSGIVELVAADGTVMASLKPGSIFGNLCNIKYNRMYITVIGCGLTEVLTIPSLKFQEILRHYPLSHCMFKKLKGVHLTHIPGTSTFAYKKQLLQAKSKHVISNLSTTTYIMLIFFLVTGAYLPCMLFLYQIAISEYAATFYAVNFFFDLCYCASMAMKLFQVVYKDTASYVTYQGILNYWSEQALFYFEIIAGLPFMYATLIMQFETKIALHTLYLLFRANVMLRLLHFFERYWIYTKRFHTKLYYVRIFYILLTLPVAIFTVTSILMLLGGLLERNMNININRLALIEADSDERFEIFTTWLFVIITAFTHTSQYVFYPVHWFFVLFITILIFFLMGYVSFLFTYIIWMMQLEMQLFWKYRRRLHRLSNYMHATETSGAFRDKMMHYGQLMWKCKHGYKYPKLLDQMPRYIKEAVFGTAFGHVIRNHSVFGKCHMDFRRQLMAKLKLDYYYHGDYIQYKGIIDHTMYWIHTGKVCALSEALDDQHDVIDTYRDGDHFGLLQGILDQTPHRYSFRAMCETRVIYLQRDDWRYLMMYFPASKAIIYEQCEKLLKQTL